MDVTVPTVDEERDTDEEAVLVGLRVTDGEPDAVQLVRLEEDSVRDGSAEAEADGEPVGERDGRGETVVVTVGRMERVTDVEPELVRL
jgi:hypothetical protein